MSSRNGNGWKYFPDLVIHPDTLVVKATITARALLILNLQQVWDSGYAAGDSPTPEVLRMQPDSAIAAAYAYGQARMRFDLDDILQGRVPGRHRCPEDGHLLPTSAAVFLCLGTGTSAVEDNRDMVMAGAR